MMSHRPVRALCSCHLPQELCAQGSESETIEVRQKEWAGKFPPTSIPLHGSARTLSARILPVVPTVVGKTEEGAWYQAPSCIIRCFRLSYYQSETGSWQLGKKVLATILEACPLVTSTDHLKYGLFCASQSSPGPPHT